jgi:lysophospholipase L1-like esterase
VLVTLGADDVLFSDILEDCVKNGYKHYFHLADLQCIEGNPGPTVRKDFIDFIPTLKKNYATLVSWIEDRAKTNNVPAPKVVFTTYANPLPRSGANCPDVKWFYDSQVRYLSSLVADMNDVIKSTIKDLKKKNVAVADIVGAYQPDEIDHRWCTGDPWAYGPSIYHFSDPVSFYSQAPFHPTPDGQASIADYVIPTVVDLFRTDLPVDLPTTTTAAPTTTTP